jgi:type IV pilus assembly protein PilA
MLRKLREMQDEEGFTLIELLVVVIIIGILAAIAIPVFLNQREKAYQKAVESDLRNAAIQVESYFADYDAYPPGTLTWANATNAVGNDTVTVSSSVSLTYENEGNGAYCIAGSHVELDVDTYYDSDGGGLLDPGTACP